MTDASSFDLFGNVITFRARPSDGMPGLVSTCRTAPGAGAPLNRHSGDDEAFCVVSGVFDFEIDGNARRVGPGEMVIIPNGAAHSFRNPGPDIAEMIILNWPGLQHEAMFSKLGHPVPLGSEPAPLTGPPPAHVAAEFKRMAAECGVELLV
jgi:quercetin dioxygenase-like cupin family protein